MKLRDWWLRTRLLLDEMRDASARALRPIDESAESIDIVELESRILLSATPLAVAASDGGANASGMGVGPESAAADVSSPESDTSLAFIKDEAQVAGQSSTATSDEPATQSSLDVVLIDSQLQDSDVLTEAASSAQVFLFDSTKDSAEDVLSNLITWLEDSNSVLRSLSITSHGSEGAFQLGTDWISNETIAETQHLWQRLGDHLASDAAVNLLGCDVAGSEEGQALVGRLAAISGADVYASDDITGQGGDWVLEYASLPGFSSLMVGHEIPLDMQLLQTANVSLAWFDQSWDYRQEITVDQSMVSGSTDLNNFAVLVSLTDANLRSTGNGGGVGQLDGGDIVFTSADGTTQLDHQIESYDPTTGELVAWVEVPTLSHNSDTTLFVYYGNALAADQWNIAGTWDATFAGVWHLHGDQQDSTANNNDGTNFGTTDDPTGQIAAGDQFDGLNDYISTSSMEAQTANEFTVSLWFNADATDYGHHLLWQGEAVANGWANPSLVHEEMHISLGNNIGGSSSDDVLSFFLGDTQVSTGDPINITTAFTDTTGWHNVTVVVSNLSTAPTATMYLDGVAVGTDTGLVSDTTRTNWDTGLRFGAPGTAQRFFDGELDEIRLATTARSADWIATEYNSQNVPGAFVTLAGVQTQLENIVPGNQATNEDTNLVFSSGNGNQISINDLDPTGSNQEVTLAVTNGTLTLNGTAGLTFSVGDGTTDATMTFQGAVSDINTALNGLTYVPIPDYSGSASLTITTIDSSLITLDIDSELKGHYTFDDTGGLGNDSSPGGANDGTVNGATTTADGTRGDVLSFDGNDEVQISGRFGDPANVTLAAWINLTGVDTLGSEVISLGDNVALGVNNSGQLRGFYYNGSTWIETIYTSSLVGAGWHHVAYTFDDTGNIATLYVDGTIVGTTNTTETISYTLGADSFIGKHGDGNTAVDFFGDIDDARVYTRALSASEIATLAADLSLIDTDAVAVTVNAVNDAPVLDNSGTMDFTSITEDQTADGGQTVASVVASAGGNRITDVDSGAIEGIAVTAATNGNGTWQYSTNGGGIWTNVGAVSDSSALLLRDTDLLRFVPDAQNGTTADLTFRAWDQTSGAFGTKVDASANGGTNAFSSATETAAISVSAVNDAPTITNGATVGLAGTDEDTTSSATLISGILAGASWADVDTAALSGLAVTGLTGNGTWQYSTDGIGWTAFGAVSSTNALLVTSTTQVRYVPDGNDGETATFSFKAWDQTTGSASANGSPSYANPGSGGGTTAHSSENATASIVVTAIDDDAPTQVANAGSTVAEGGTDTLSQAELEFTDTEQPATSVTFSVTGGPANGQLELTTNPGVAITSFTQDDINNNRVVYIHDGSNTTTGDFTFDVDDGQGNAVTGQAFNITVTPVDDDAPTQVANTGSTVAEGGTDTLSQAELEFTDTEQPATGVAFTVTTGPANGQLELTTNPGVAITSFTQDDINNNRVVYIHDGSDTTAGDFTFDVDDGQGNAVTGQTFNITVTPVDDDAPTQIANAGSTVAEGGTDTLSQAELEFTDTEQPATAVTFTVTTGPANGQLELTTNPGVAITSFTQDDINNNRVVYIHDGSNTTTGDFTFDVDDGQGNAVTGQAFNITVTPVDDDAPTQVASAGSTVAEGGTDTLSQAELEFTDTEQPATAVTFTVTAGPANGQLELTTNPGVAITSFTQDDINNNRVVYIHDGSDTTAGDFTFDVDDGQGNAVTGQTFNNTVTAVNDDPLNAGSLPSDIVVTEDTLSDVDLSAVDLFDSDAGGGNLTVTLATASGGDLYAISGGGVTVTGTGTGVLTLTGTLGNLNAFLNVTSNVQYLHGTPGTNGNNADTIQVSVTDNGNTGVGGGGVIALGTTNVDINAVNDPPTAINLSGTAVNENAVNGTLIGTASAIDPDIGDVFSYSLLDSAAGRFTIDNVSGDLTVADGSRLDFEAASSHSITIRTTDSGGLTHDQSFTISLADLNESPIAQGENYTSFLLGGITIAQPGVLANDIDIDGNPLTAALLSNVSHGSLTLNADGSFTYVPDASFSGVDSFTYAASDGTLTSAPVTVTIEVEAIADPGAGEGDSEESESTTEEPTEQSEETEQTIEEAPVEAPPVIPQVAAATNKPGSENQSVQDQVEHSISVAPTESRPEGLLEEERDHDGVFRITARVSASAGRPDAESTYQPAVESVAGTPLSVFANSNDWGANIEGEGELSSQDIVLGTTTVIASAVSVGYVVWLVRGSTLVASLVASMPAWTSFDPLPILTSFDHGGAAPKDGESLRDLVC